MKIYNKFYRKGNYFPEMLFTVIITIFMITCKHEPFPGPEIINEEINTDTVEFIFNTTSCDENTIYFNNQILPIFISNCAISGCHDAVSAEEGVILTNYTNIMQKIEPGNPNDSEYYGILLETDPEKLMPRTPGTENGNSLPQDQINLIRDWILQGAKNNYCDACDTTEYFFANAIKPIFQLNCATSVGCHAQGSPNGAFTTYDLIMQRVNNGLIEKRVIAYKNMPPAAPLTDCDMFLIKKWIDNGAFNN